MISVKQEWVIQYTTAESRRSGKGWMHAQTLGKAEAEAKFEEWSASEGTIRRQDHYRLVARKIYDEVIRDHS